jgi:UDP-MurNAc hydroxylase
MRVTYYGQACTLIEVAGRTILTDPWLTEGAYLGTWHHTHLLGDAGVTPSTFRKDIDYLFLSHEHEDHLDPETLAHFRRDVPILICRFATPTFRRHLEGLGLTNIQELSSGIPLNLGDGLEVTIFGSAEYTNDAAILVSGEGHSVFNETDCKLDYRDLVQLRERRIDLGFYMFSGANWFPMLYEAPDELLRERVCRRRRALLRGFVERVRLTQPRIAVPAAGPCTVLDPDLLWLNSPERGIFIDPLEAVAAVEAADLPSRAVCLAATDVWDSDAGVVPCAPAAFRLPRQTYISDAAARMAPELKARRAAEPPAGADLPDRVVEYFEHRVAAQSRRVRQRIGAKVALCAKGTHGGRWTIDFTRAGPPFVRAGTAQDWTYRIEVEDRVLYPFVSGRISFLEDLFLSLRVRLARKPDVFNEPLYHFFYDPDPGRLERWYASH